MFPNAHTGFVDRPTFCTVGTEFFRGSKVVGGEDVQAPPSSSDVKTLRTGLLNCLNVRSRGLTFSHRASCI